MFNKVINQHSLADSAVLMAVPIALFVTPQERQWELQQRAAQLTQLDMAMNERSSNWDERLVKLETALMF